MEFQLSVKHLLLMFAFIFLIINCGGPSQLKIETARYSIIPKPQKLTEKNGNFNLNSDTKLAIVGQDEKLAGLVDYVRQQFGVPTGFAFEEAPDAQSNVLILKIDEQVKGKDGSYRLTVDPDKIEITAPNARGLFYGLQTVRQLLPYAIESRDLVEGVEWSLPCVEIEDGPRFVYRGMHLDVGRHFFPVSFIKKYIDLLALQKMNYFHWHLTEDQGWRIEIKKYPKLTQVGAFRKQTITTHASKKPYIYDGQPYGGFYTQDEIREIVAYAQKRFVTIVPEIEMPGHSSAALAAYPELGCTGGPYQVADRWGIFKDVYCAGNEKTFQFLEDVLSEVAELFPGKYIHIGGDECPKDRWKTCPKCQARMKKEGLKDEHELQSYFIHRIENFLLSKNRYIIGWDEILEGGLAPQATVMSWRGIKGGIAAARQHHDVIMTPTSHCYFDYYQADPATQPLAIGGFLPLQKVYFYEPVPEELTEEEARYILGAQGNVWTEYMDNEKEVEYMAFPRACALAEVVWTNKEQKNWFDFLSRLQGFYGHLYAMGVNYFRGNVGELIELNKKLQ
ncbi:Glycoside hydrolase, family 20, catalytic core [Caldithrix abyssi DSM 13497]|uniref:beta-N-acetylhexosaminidase n=1 Tax=Caldithrix abyssi DSM 13497 TaxID=880073 RepID=H1XWP7_CALAY|nr:beta-N-acetylhexosaminidase [Caldithrix abyssi]APF19087.1 hexosaminidase [Caldithrix abyssi DSM 13497]EHO43023.1 Glycoside hydrolase, family 20, catalytic core [Caldithrix abyssi DSM 13497]